MSLRSKNKVKADFSMSSMTDIIFLLLIFFMLTSTFITPSGLNVNLPTSKISNIQMQKTSVTISKDLRYMVNDKEVNKNDLKSVLSNELGSVSKEERLVILHVDKEVPVEHFVDVAGIASELNAKISIATKPNN